MNSSDCICCPIEMKIGKTKEVNMNIQKTSNVNFELGDRCCSVPSYNVLPDKPQINGNILINNMTPEELGIIEDKNYIHNQTTASNTWVIEHNLNKYPAVSVMNSANEEVIGEVVYDSVNKLTIIFTSAFKGKATLN